MTDAMTTPPMRALHFITRQWWAGVLLLLLGGVAWFRARGRTLTLGDVRVRPVHEFFAESALVVRLRSGERERLPLLLTATEEMSSAHYSRTQLHRAIMAALQERRPEVIQARPLAHHADGLPGPHVWLEFRALDGDLVETNVYVACPAPDVATLGTAVEGRSGRGRRIMEAVDDLDDLRDDVQRRIGYAASLRCPGADESHVIPVDTLRAPVSAVQVRVGVPQSLAALGVVTGRQRGGREFVMTTPWYSVADTSLARITTLGIEGVRPGTTWLEVRQRLVRKGMATPGQAVTRIPLTVAPAERGGTP